MNKVLKNGKMKLLIMLVFTIFFSTIYIITGLGYDNVAMIYDSTYGQDGSGTNISLNFNSDVIVQSNFTHNTVTNNQRLYINETATYKLAYSCTWEGKAGGSGGSARRIYENNIRINNAINLVPSQSEVYIRGDNTGSQPGGHISSTSATVLANLTNGDYIELRGGLSGGNTARTDSRKECFMTAQKLNTRSIEVYDGTGGQTVTSLGDNVVVNLDSTYYNGDNSLYSLASDRLTVSETGWYKLSYTSCVDQTSGARISPQSWIRKNGNTNLSLSFSFAGYTRGASTGRDKNCNRANTLINLNSSDYIELQTGIYNTENSPTLSLLADQSWLIMEKVELDSSIISINSSGQQMDHGIPAAVNFDQNDKIGNYVSHVGSSSQITFDKSGLYEITYNIGYQDGASADRVITCGYLRKNGGSEIIPSRQCIYTRGDAQARTGTVSTLSIINVSKNDYIEIMMNVTGEAGTNELIQIQKGTTWMTVTKINETVELLWDAATLNLGTTNISQGNLINSETFTIKGEGTNNVETTCISGDCSTISDDWIDGTTLTGTDLSKTVTFTCNDGIVGDFWANIKINSSQYPSGTNLNVSCSVDQTYGILDIVLNNPTVDSETNIIQNESFIFNATISCNGLTNSTCGNTSITPKYNNTGSTFISIPTSSNTPLWTNSTSPQYCNLDDGDSCTLSWYINMTGSQNSSHKLNVNATSEFIQTSSNVSGNTTITIVIPPADSITWESSSKNLGSGGLNLGNVTGTNKLIPTNNHTGINVTCNLGSCNLINDDWIDGTNLNGGNQSDVTFNCDDSAIGTYWATFNATSNEDPSPEEINVSCTITQTYGHLNITIITPPENLTTEVNYLATFPINATVICEGTPGASCGDVSANVRYSEKTLNYGDGTDGQLSVTSSGTIINNYTYMSGNENSGGQNIIVNSAVEFSIGDEILIIQMQDGLAVGSAGNYEFAIIENISGTNITLTNTLTNNYGSGTFNSGSSSATQIIRVPQYTNITISSAGSITAPAWNGQTGGIVVFRAQKEVTTDGYIDVSNKGFRGGDCNGCGNGAWGDQGEGTSGLGTTSTGSNENGGGGGDAGAGDGAPGGGGGYGTSGGTGSDDSSFDSSGGITEGNTNLDKIFFGGGAGAGGDNFGSTPLPQNVDGGGIVIIFAKQMENAKITATGETGIFGSSGASGGVSGSGAGGTIWIGSNYMNLSDVNASGGPAVNGHNGDVGGVGGDGRIRLDFLEKNGIETPTAGYTSSNFSETLSLITNTSGALPFELTTAELLSCPVTLYEGATCNLNWEGYVNSFIETTYKINVNASSSASILDNQSSNSTVIVNANPIFTISFPENNSKYLDTHTFNLTGTSNLPIIWAGYYLNNNLSNLTTMENTSSTNWFSVISDRFSRGWHNVTFLFNESITQQNNSGTYNFLILEDQHVKISKNISSNGPDNTYLINEFAINMLNRTADFEVIDFVHNSTNPGSWTPPYSLINTTSGPIYSGNIYDWNMTLTTLQTAEVNYSITGVGDYNMINNFIIGGR